MTGIFTFILAMTLTATTTSQAIGSSTPGFQAFNPKRIAWQADFVYGVTRRFDYVLGVHQVLLSGTVGSGKSLPAAHIAVRHCLEFPGARVLIGRQSLPDLKRTLYKKIKEHCRDLPPAVIRFRDNDAFIRFANGSEIIGYSWSDADWESFGSLELSMFIMEEATENQGKYKEAWFRLLTRTGRLPHVPQSVAIALCNPDGPSHWLYDHFELANDEGLDRPPVTRSSDPTKHVFYSRTEDNPFLPATYIETLRKNIDPKLADRLLRGRWVDIAFERPYHGYERRRNYSESVFAPSLDAPLRLSWDFNIGDGKPLSAVAFQYLEDHFHFFDQVVVDGMRTESSCEEWAAKGILDHGQKIIVHGDATGKARDTRSNLSDYGIIERFLANYKDPQGRRLDFELQVTPSNPPVRKRQNQVNAYCINDLGESRLTVYSSALTVDEGLRKTKLKKGSSYIEDDTDRWQHIVTAAGYGIHQTLIFKDENSKSTQRELI